VWQNLLELPIEVDGVEDEKEAEVVEEPAAATLN